MPYFKIKIGEKKTVTKKKGIIRSTSVEKQYSLTPDFVVVNLFETKVFQYIWSHDKKK